MCSASQPCDELHFKELLSLLGKINLYVRMIEKRLNDDVTEDTSDDPKTLEGTVLREYQRIGYRWIVTLYENGMNGILADEMGLGKTVQVIAALAGLIEAGVYGPFLIVVPLSLLSVWADQLAAFAPRLPSLIYYGSLTERHKLRKRIRRRVRIRMRDPIEQYKSVLSEDTPKTCYLQDKSCSVKVPSNPRESPLVLHTYESSLEAGYHASSASESLCSFPSSCSSERPTNTNNRVGKPSVSSYTTDPSVLQRLDGTISGVLNNPHLNTELKNVDSMEFTNLLASMNDHYCNDAVEVYEETSVYPMPQFSRLPESVESPAVKTPNSQSEQDIGNGVPYGQGSVTSNLPSSKCYLRPDLGTARVKISNSLQLPPDDHFHESQTHDRNDYDKPSLPPGSCAQSVEHEGDCNSMKKIRSTNSSGISSILNKLPNPERLRKQVNAAEHPWTTMDDDSCVSARKCGLQLDGPYYNRASIKITAPSDVDCTTDETPASCDVLKTELIDANLDVGPNPKDLIDLASPAFNSIQLSDSGGPQTHDFVISSLCNPYLYKTVNDVATCFTSVDCLDKVHYPAGEVVVPEDCVETVNSNEFGLNSEGLRSSPSTKDVDLKAESPTGGLTSTWKAVHSHDNRTLALKNLDDVITQVLVEWKEIENEQLNHSDSTGILDHPITSIPTAALPPNEPSHKPATISTCIDLCNQRADSKTDNNSTFHSPDNQDQSTGTNIKVNDWGTSSTAPKDQNDVFWAYPLVLTTYEVAMRDSKFLQNVHFKGLIVDEGQRLKNPATRLYGKLSKLSTGLRLLVTGTPLQNRISELWALLHFILPEIFTSLEMFENWFDPAVLSEHEGRDRLVTAEIERSLITKLHCIISPFVLRRTKAETKLLLPPKREILLRVGMTTLQQ
ncbi:ATP-dependent DNA helicase, partial [Paragonimus westermani]